MPASDAPAPAKRIAAMPTPCASISTASRAASRAFPVRRRTAYGRIAGVAGDKVVWTLLPIVGAHGRGRHKKPPAGSRSFDFATGRQTAADREGRRRSRSPPISVTLVVREGKRLRAIAAEPSRRRARRPPATQRPPSRKSGWIDLGPRPPRRSSRAANGAQMLREVWRLQRDQFWVPDMSGIDWERDLRSATSRCSSASRRAASCPT